LTELEDRGRIKLKPGKQGQTALEALIYQQQGDRQRHSAVGKREREGYGGPDKAWFNGTKDDQGSSIR